jgi:hypothetical protein
MTAITELEFERQGRLTNYKATMPCEKDKFMIKRYTQTVSLRGLELKKVVVVVDAAVLLRD